jgi:hypothetical protein
MAKILARKQQQQQPQSDSSFTDSCGISAVASAATTTVPVVQIEVVKTSSTKLTPSLTALKAAGSTSERALKNKDKRISKAKQASVSDTTNTNSGASVKHQAVGKSTRAEFLKALVAMRKDKGALALRNIYGMMIHSAHSGQRLHQVTSAHDMHAHSVFTVTLYC